jgi:hypothetical protein
MARAVWAGSPAREMMDQDCAIESIRHSLLVTEPSGDQLGISQAFRMLLKTLDAEKLGTDRRLRES